jgi:hypothetical protein
MMCRGRSLEKEVKKMKSLVRLLLISSVTFLLLTEGGYAGSSQSRLECYSLGSRAKGCTETVDNIVNLTVVSKDQNVYKAEYRAGFIQGKLHKEIIFSARDNYWDMAYLTDPDHTFPKQLPPSEKELSNAQEVLIENYKYTLCYIRNVRDPELAKDFKRLVFRLLGIYHGTQLNRPASLNFRGDWLPELPYFSPSELVLGYEKTGLTFMDVYFINAYGDLLDVMSNLPEVSGPTRMSKCSAFVKKTADDIFITHNSWSGYLSQTMVMNLFVNDDFMTFNALSPGLIGSLTDFGYNNKGLMFNETTHRASHMEPKTYALWMFWRATLAEQFGASLDDFFRYVSLEPSGTYMNGYMVVDAKTEEIGLIEMSYKSFVYFKPDGKGGYTVITKPDGLSIEYDAELLQGDYILGINYPVSYQIRDDLQSKDNRPARRRQFMERIGNVNDIETAKTLITYTDPNNPLSIYGRWDLGYGETPYRKIVPDGSIDAKAASASMAAEAMSLKGTFSLHSHKKGFWMKYGTPYVNGLPFIWSSSQWSGQKLRDVPDIVDGQYNYLDLYLK